MGLLVDGVWQDDVSRTKDGHFIRPTTRFRNWVTPDGSPGPSGEGGFAAEAGRYHLYVSLACPWAHRTVIFRKLKGLENVISMSIVSPDMLKDGWTFNKDEGSSGDDVNGKSKLSEIYLLADPRYSGRVSVPVLWDKKRKTIVNNEFARNHPHAQFGVRRLHQCAHRLLSEDLRAEIDRINDLVYPNINNGVYRAGFATSQAAYEAAFRNVFDALDEIEQILSQHRYLVGNTITEADWRLFSTLIRFDAVYYSHFKCNWRHIYEYPNLSNYVRDLYQVPGVAETVSLEQIKRHYYGSQRQVNPTGIVPVGPQLDFAAPHDRARLAITFTTIRSLPRRETSADARACGAAGVVRQGIGRKESVRDDFVIGLRLAVLAEIAHDVQRDMIAPRRPPVEVDAVQLRRSSDLNIAFLGQFARQGFEKRLAGLHAAAGQMPAVDV